MVSVVIITQDSAERLGRCLELLTKAPEIIVADTGSSDDTLQVAMSFGAKVCQIPWTNNFSEARTLAQEYATHDLVMRLDDDEFLRGADGLAEIMTLAQSHPAGICVKRTQPSGETDMLLRVYSRSAWKWHYPVHELLRSKSGKRLHVVDAQTSWIEHRPSSRKRNYADMILSRIGCYAGDPYMSYMCLKELVLEKRWLEALQAFHRYEKTAGGYQWHRSQADIFHGQILKECGQLRDALEILTRPALASSRAEALHLAIEIAVELGIDAASVSSLRQQALTLRVPMETGMSGNPQIPYVIDRTKYA
jgi:glycosyltransferase involved in cell wall biosynthesis